MPSALFEIYQKNFDKTLKRLSGMLEVYQNQIKEAQSVTLKEMELNISEMERSISQMELEVIIEKIPDNKKKLTKIIENNKNIVKQYKREIQDLKYKEQSILNKQNLAHIPSSKKKKTVQLNFLKDENNTYDCKSNTIYNEDEDTALFIDKNNYKKNNFDKYVINESNDEMSMEKDEGIKRINEHHSDSDNEAISKIKNNNGLSLSSKQKEKGEKDKDSEDNKYNLNKNSRLNKIFKIIFNVIQFLIYTLINFSKNVLYKGYKKLKHYLHHRYGQANSRRIMMFLFILGFIIVYSLIVFLWNSYKMRKADKPMINLIEKNNSIIKEFKNETKDNTKNNTLENSISENITQVNKTSINITSTNISNNTLINNTSENTTNNISINITSSTIDKYTSISNTSTNINNDISNNNTSINKSNDISINSSDSNNSNDASINNIDLNNSNETSINDTDSNYSNDTIINSTDSNKINNN